MLSRREELLANINRQRMHNPNAPLPVVSLEDFFGGNADEGSIGCNLPKHPGLLTFFNVLAAIRERPETEDVLIEIYEAEPDADWPFSERVYIITRATQEQVSEWVATLEPTEIGLGYAFGTPALAPRLEPDVPVYSVWWD